MEPKDERQSIGVRLKIALTKFRETAKKASPVIFSRSTAANCLMIAFIIMTSVGAWQINPPIGFIVGGVGCGIFGFILGLD